MPVNLPPLDPAQLHPVAGVRWGIAEAGVRKANRKDLSLLLLDAGTSVAGVFTQNRFCAAPVQVCREHLQAGQGIRALVINTGNTPTAATLAISSISDDTGTSASDFVTNDNSLVVNGSIQGFSSSLGDQVFVQIKDNTNAVARTFK